MRFIDEANIYLKAGNGGAGCVSFRREKYIEYGGPNGGNGGRGANIIFRSNSHLNTLLKFRFKHSFKAANGMPGKGRDMTGKSGEDMVLEVPVGTQIFSIDKSLLIHDFVKDKEEFVILKGGQGGLGNACFKSSTNRAPRKSTPGEEGEELEVSLQLKLLADVGLVGLPNVGKSSIINKFTNAKPKTGNYNFTSLKPTLGVASVLDEEFVIADIPGLIKGASQGLGLGDRFLKHIERCSVLVHLLDIGSVDIFKDYSNIRKELGLYSKNLLHKQEIIVINKIDVSGIEIAKEIMRDFYKKMKEAGFIYQLESKIEKKIFLTSLVTDFSKAGFENSNYEFNNFKSILKYLLELVKNS